MRQERKTPKKKTGDAPKEGGENDPAAGTCKGAAWGNRVIRGPAKGPPQSRGSFASSEGLKRGKGDTPVNRRGKRVQRGGVQEYKGKKNLQKEQTTELSRKRSDTQHHNGGG